MSNIMHNVAVSACCHVWDHSSNVQILPKWFAVHTYSRHEKRVAQHLNQRQIEHYLPLFRVQRKWSDGSKVTLELPLFPGYIFVHISQSERICVMGIPGAVNIVSGVGGVPAPLPDVEIDALRFGADVRHAEPHPLLKVGRRARIRSGAFAGMEGIVIRQKSSLRVVLTMDLIMQSIAVEVDAEDLEPIEAGLHHS